MRICIGLCGLTCSGKDTVADIFTKYGFNKYNYTDEILVPLSKRKKLPHTRDAYRILLNKLGKMADEILFRKISIGKDNKVIIPNVRLNSTLDFWRNRKGFKFYLVKVDADYETRYKRYVDRKRKIDPIVSREGFSETDGKDRNVNDVGEILEDEKFDFEIVNNGNFKELENKCLGIIKVLK